MDSSPREAHGSEAQGRMVPGGAPHSLKTRDKPRRGARWVCVLGGVCVMCALVFVTDSVVRTCALLCYKTKNSHQNTAKKIPHFPKITFPREGNNMVGIDPSMPPEEASPDVNDRAGVFLNLKALKRFNRRNRSRCLCLQGWHVRGDSDTTFLVPACWEPGPLKKPPKPGWGDRPQQLGGAGWDRAAVFSPAGIHEARPSPLPAASLLPLHRFIFS